MEGSVDVEESFVESSVLGEEGVAGGCVGVGGFGFCCAWRR